MKTTFFRSLAIFILMAGDFLFLGQFAKAKVTNHLVISEFATRGLLSASDEFVELYNPTENPISLIGWRLQYKQALGGNWENKTGIAGLPAEATIKPHAFYLLAGKDYLDQNTDYRHTANWGLADNGHIRLTDLSGNTVDLVGYGTNVDSAEGEIAAPNHGTVANNKSVERKIGGEEGNSQDTNVNGNDFFVREQRNPDDSQSSAKPPILEPPPQCTPNWSCADWQPGPNTICSDETFTQTRTCNDSNSCGILEGKPPESQQSTGTKDCTGQPLLVNPGDIIINEFVPYQKDEETEWIELYNKTENNIVLTNWTIEDGTEKPKNLDGLSISANNFLVLKKGIDFTFILNDSGDIITLKNYDTVIDKVSYGNWDENGDGDFSQNAPKADDPNSVARIVDGGDSNNDLADFTVTTTLTKGLPNIITAPAEDTPSGGGTRPPTAPSSPLSWPVGSLLINEFVADPDDGGSEWIELFNPTSSPINLTDWTMEDGGETVTKLSGSVSSLNFYVIEKPKGLLNNSGDIIILKDPAGLIIDDVAYGDWSDGDESDNAPRADDPNSVARIKDGQDTNNDFNDFIESTPTKGTANIGGQFSGGVNFAEFIDKIIINEIFPNPEGSDNDNEFIELKNIGSKDVDLKDWKIGDASSKRYIVKSSDFSDTKIKANGFFVLYRKITGIALNNTGRESVKIFTPNNNLINSIEFIGPAEEDQSYAKNNNEWSWTTTLTSGKENIITQINKLPTAVISSAEEGAIGEEIFFDGSDSYDEDGEIVSYLWDFGDSNAMEGSNITHAYGARGNFKIILTVKDEKGETNSAEAFINIFDNNSAENVSSESSASIVINEALPNPEGSDNEEWIELFNLSADDVDLSGWQLDDDEGGSKPYKIPAGTIIKANDFLLLEKEKTKLALNNTFDAVRLINPAGEIVFETNYDEVPENASWARDENNNWQWTSTLTPGEKNIFQFTEKTVKTAAKKSTASKKKTVQFTPTNLLTIREYDLGDSVIAQGQVIAPPGLLGTQIFYIANEESCPGIQVYMYKKDFPDLKLGDLVQVSGVLSETGGERRIKIAEKTDIKILASKEPLTPKPIQTGDVEEDLEGCLVIASAKIIEKDSSNLFLDDDTGELKAYLKAITKPKLAINDSVEAVGIVSETKTGFRILPRYDSDLRLIAPAIDETSLNVPAEDKSGDINGFLGVATGILGLTTLGLSIKSGVFANWWKKNKGV